MLLDAQTTLARLYTDERLLNEFLEDRERFCRGLGDDDRRFFDSLDAGQLRFFADGLLVKRRREAARIIPLTEAVLGDRFTELFAEHSRTILPAGDKKHAADAMAFCEFVLESGSAYGAVERDAVRYELARLSMRLKLVREAGVPTRCRAVPRMRPAIRFQWLHHAIPAVSRPMDVREAARRLTPVLMVNVFGRGGVWYW